MPIVEVKGVGEIEFPDEMSQEEILTVLRRDYPPQQPQGTPQAASEPAVAPAPTQPTPEDARAAKGAALREEMARVRQGEVKTQEAPAYSPLKAALTGQPLKALWGHPIGAQIRLGLMEAPTQLGSAAAYTGSAIARQIGKSRFQLPMQRLLAHKAADTMEQVGLKADEYTEAIETVGRATKGPDKPRQLTAMAGSIAPSIAGGAIGSLAGPQGAFAGMIAGAGTHQFGATYGEALKAYREADDPKAEEKAINDAIFSGAITAVTTSAFGRTGIDHLAKTFGRKAVRLGFQKFLKQAGLESTEETVDQIFQSILAKMRYNPGMTKEEAMQEIGMAALGGLVIGGVALTPKLLSDLSSKPEVAEPGATPPKIEPPVLPPGMRPGAPPPVAPTDVPRAIEVEAEPTTEGAKDATQEVPVEPTPEAVQEVQPAEAPPEAGGEAAVAPEAAAPPAAKPEVGLGLGAASVEEMTPPPSVTSIRNAQIDAEFAARGLPAPMKAGRMDHREAWDAAMARIDDDFFVQDTLIKELIKKPRAIDNVEDMLLLHRNVDLHNAEAKAAADLFEATGEGRQDDANEAQRRFDSYQKQLVEAAQAMRVAGTATARGLEARKAFAAQDFSLVAMEMQTRAARKGKPLTVAEHAELAEMSRKLLATQEELATVRKQKEELHAEVASAREVESIIKRGRKGRAQRKLKRKVGLGKDPSEVRKNLLESLRKRAEGEGDELPPNLNIAAHKLALAHVELGVDSRDALIDAVHADLQTIWPDITRRETMDAISGYGIFTPLDMNAAKAKLRQYKGEMQQIGKLEDMAAGLAPSKTGKERPVPGDVWRRLTQEVNEAKKRGGYIVTDPAQQLRTQLQTTKTRLQHQIADLEHQIATGERIVRSKPTPLNDAEVDTLKARRDELKTQFEEIFGTRQLTDAQRSAMALKAVERSIADLEQRLKTGDLSSKRRGKKAPSTPELEAARARRDALQEELNTLRELTKPKKTPEEIALQVWKTRTSNKNAEIREQLANNDLRPKVRPKLDLSGDPEAVALLAEHLSLVDQHQRRLQAERIKNMTALERALYESIETMNFSRNALSSADISATLRQGGFLGMGRPVDLILKGMRGQLRAFRSEALAREADAAMRLDPYFQDFLQAGGYFAPIDATRLEAGEELMMSRIAHKTPIIRHSNRAFITFLNWQRLQAFKAMVKSQEGGGYTPSAEFQQAIANFVNIATGRGMASKLPGTMSFLAKIFWSPRLAISRWQLIFGTAFRKAPWEAKKEIAKVYARFFMGVGAFLGLGVMAGGEIERDLTSASGWKLRFGNFRLDVMAALLPQLRLLARLAYGERKTKAGDIAEAGRLDETVRYLRTKAAPFPGTIVNIVEGENVVGEKTTPASVVQGLTLPLSIHDTVATMEELGVARGTAAQVLETLGTSGQTYE